MDRQLRKRGWSAFWVSSLRNAAVLRVLAFEKNPLGLKKPDRVFFPLELVQLFLNKQNLEMRIT